MSIRYLVPLSLMAFWNPCASPRALPTRVIAMTGRIRARLPLWIALGGFILCGSFHARTAYAQVDAPRGLGQAASWIYPCELFEEEASGQALKNGNQRTLAALCQGLITGVMSVNYISPPYLPFCEADDATQLEYVRTFLAFMKANPSFAEKPLGLVLLVAFGRAYPKGECAGTAP